MMKWKQRLELALNGSDLGLWDWDLVTNQVFYSERWLTMLGYQKGELPDDFSTWVGLVHPEDLNRAQAAVQSHLEGSTGLYESEFRMRHKRGDWLCILARGNVAERDSAGQPTRIVGTHLDVTAGFRIREQLRLFQRAVQASGGSILILRGLEVVYLNPAASAILGLKEGETLRHPAVREAVAEGEGCSFDSHWGEIPCNITITPVEGQATHFVLLVTDLRESRRLQSQQYQLETSQRLAPLGFWHWDCVSGKIHWSDGVFSIYERSREEGEPSYEEVLAVHEPASRRLLEDVVGRALEQGVEYREDFQLILGPNQTRRWIRAIGAPRRDRHGTVVELMGSIVDITDLKRIQAELEEARQRAEQAARAKSLFLANLSHELRTPMNAIIGLSSLLGKSLSDPQDLDHIQLIRRSGEDLLLLINEILDFSKIEAGKLRLEEHDFSLSECLGEILDLFRPQAESKNLHLELLNQEAGRVFLRGDAARFRQVLYNLLGNAIKFTPQGSITVALEGVRPHQECLQIEVSVRDTGIGIDSDRLESIFDAFTQGDSSTARLFGGTGLGLSISRALCCAMGGDLVVSSQPGQGSNFVCTVLMYPGNRPPHQADSPTDAIHKDLRILVAEDNPVNQKVCQALLSRLGYCADLVSNGLEVLEACCRQTYDVVLMDLQMPELDGLEATRRLRRSLPAQNQPHIIALTANVAGQDRADCHQAGMNDFLGKPIRLGDLSQALNRSRPDPA